MPEICDIDSTYRMADHLLTVLASGTSQKVGQPFKRAYVAFQEPVAEECCDGGQLNVHVGTIRPREPNWAEGEMCVTDWLVEFTVTLFACYPTGVDNSGAPIDQRLMDEASAFVYRQGHALYETARKAIIDNSIYPAIEGVDPLLERRPVTIGALEPLSQESTCVGWRFTLTLTYAT